jgi:triosephosphate isomerase
MRRKIIAANWKMNKSFHEALLFSEEIAKRLTNSTRENLPEIIIIPSFPYLASINDIFSKINGLSLGAQNCSAEVYGAFTGEVSADMIKSCGATYVILGHSERRSYFKEDNRLLAKKAKVALEFNLSPIFCVGETQEQRKKNFYLATIEEQIRDGLFFLSKEEFSNVVIAYEPVWAIGTGETASPEQAEEIHQYIRLLIKNKYDENTAENTPILYGGSCKAENASELFSQPNIDGGLIGGASLEVDSLMAIVDKI